MTAEPDQQPAKKPARPEALVPCAKCEEMNPGGSSRCGFCGAHLYVSCHHCGHSNQRVFSRCTHCGERLHRSLWRRWRKKLFPDRSKLTPFQLLALIIGVVVTYLIILKLTNLTPSSTQ